MNNQPNNNCHFYPGENPPKVIPPEPNNNPRICPNKSNLLDS